MLTTEAEAAMVACIDVVARSGATDVEFGHLEDDVPIEQARWWATATYRGKKLTIDEQRDPIDALMRLAERVCNNGTCTGCQRSVLLLTGQPGLWIASKPRCLWQLDITGKQWVRGCDGRGRKPNA